MKKFLSLALALIMVLSLVACGDTASDNTDNSNTDANTEQTGEIKGLTAEERAKEFITVGTGPTSGTSPSAAHLPPPSRSTATRPPLRRPTPPARTSRTS